MKFRRFPVSSDKRLKINKEEKRTDFGAPQRWQHAGRMIEVTSLSGEIAARATEEHILDRLFLARKISARQKAAALRFQGDYRAAGLVRSLTSSYNPSYAIGHGHGVAFERSEKQEVAYQNWRQAMIAMGALSNDTVMTVVCHDIMPDSAHLLLLQIGLIKLAKYYGILECELDSGLDDNVDQAAARHGAVGRSGSCEHALSRTRLLH